VGADPAHARRVGFVLTLAFAAACRFPTFEPVFEQYGMIAQDYRVDRLQVLAVHAQPPLAVAGTPRTVEALVVAPGGTRHDARVVFSVCGLLDVGSVGVSDLRCFENDALVDRIGAGNPVAWDVPDISFPECVPFDVLGTPDRDPGENCVSVVPVLAIATGSNGAVAAGANTVVVPAMEVPETVSHQWSDTGAVDEDPVTGFTAVTSLADPSLPVTLTASGDVRPGARVDLEVTLEDTHYNHVAWWVDGGKLDQSGRTVVVRPPDDPLGHAYNRLIVPDGAARVTVWVVLTEWFDVYEDPPNPSNMPVSQPAWTELTLEVQP
jgi:hypothetical protein